MNDKPKLDYAALLMARADANARPIQSGVVCLTPARVIAHREAQAVLAEALQMEARGEKVARRRYSATAPSAVEAARAAVEQTYADAREHSIRLYFEGRTAAETEKAMKAAGPDAEVGELNRAFLLDAYLYAEDMDGERLPEVDRDKLAALLPTLTAGEINILMLARNQASGGIDFPS